MCISLTSNAQKNELFQSETVTTYLAQQSQHSQAGEAEEEDFS